MSPIVSGRAEACAGRPWPADRVEHWPTERLIPYANNPRLIAERDPLPGVGRVGLGVRIRLPPAGSHLRTVWVGATLASVDLRAAMGTSRSAGWGRDLGCARSGYLRMTRVPHAPEGT
jgi:hypothetical protein